MAHSASPFVYVGPRQNPAWLATAAEEPIIEPDRPIVDAHHHLWSTDGDRYLLDELLADIRQGHNVVSTVHVQAFTGYRADGPVALRPVGETEFISAVADRCARRSATVRVAAGVVGFADLCLGSRVAPILEAHIEAGGGRFRGVRMIAARDDGIVSALYRPPPANLMSEARFRDGFAELSSAGLSFDAYVYHHQLDELAALATAFPDVTIVLDHCGMALGIGPYEGKNAEVWETWTRGISALACLPNMVVKLGGLSLAFWGFGFHERPVPPSSLDLASAWRPYVEFCIEAFGAERCMFESNFPPDKAGCDYRTLWNAFKRLTSGGSENEKAALFRGTATRVYRL